MTTTTEITAPAKTPSIAFCKECYLKGIERQITGFNLPNGHWVPPLLPGQIASLRLAAAEVIAAHPEHEAVTARHPKHAGVSN